MIERVDTVIEHPHDALLVVEVADSSLRLDLTLKSVLYAAAGVPEYWVADVERQLLNVLTHPSPHGYGMTEVLGTGRIVRPSAFDAEPLALSELFAGL